MNKDHLAKLQQKVNRLMRTSSEDSDSQNIITVVPQNRQLSSQRQSEPETVRKCIDLIKQNKQLKIALEKQKNKKEELRRELVKQRREKEEQKKTKEHNSKVEVKVNKQEMQQYRKLGKIQAELQQERKRNDMIQKMLGLERKKNRTLSSFINKNLPDMQNAMDRIMASLDAKLEAHFSQINI